MKNRSLKTWGTFCEHRIRTREALPTRSLFCASEFKVLWQSLNRNSVIRVYFVYVFKSFICVSRLHRSPCSLHTQIEFKATQFLIPHSRAIPESINLLHRRKSALSEIEKLQRPLSASPQASFDEPRHTPYKIVLLVRILSTRAGPKIANAGG